MDRNKKAKLIDNKIDGWIENRDFQALRKAYPDWQSLMVVADQGPDVPRNSLLARIVKLGDAPFLNKFLHTYFNDEDIDSLSAKNEFLNGRDEDGRRINYHYFHDYLPQEYTSIVDKAYDIEKTKTKLPAAEKERMSKLYVLLKKHKTELERYYYPADIEEIDFAESLDYLDRGFDIKTFAEEMDYPPLILRNLAKPEQEFDQLALVITLQNAEDSNLSLLNRSYRFLDFPEDYAHLAKSIDIFEQEWKNLKSDNYLHPAASVFINDKGYFRIEDRFDENVKTNSLKPYIGYAGEDKKNRSRVVLNAPAQAKGKNTTVHEIAHRVDLSGKNNISNNDIIKYAWSLIVTDKFRNLDRRNIYDRLIANYEPDQYGKESLANIIQYAVFKKSGYDKDHLLRSVYKLFGRFSEAKEKNYTAVLQRISTMSSRVGNKPDLDDVSDKVNNYLAAVLAYRHEVDEFGYCSGKDLNEASRSLTEALHCSKAFAHKGQSGVEKELSIDIINELRKINQIIINGASQQEVPHDLINVKTANAVEVIFAKAADDFNKNSAWSYSKHLDYSKNLYAANLDASTKDYNEICLYTAAYCNHLEPEGLLLKLRAWHFENDEELTKIMNRHFENMQNQSENGIAYNVSEICGELGLLPKNYCLVVNDIGKEFSEQNNLMDKVVLTQRYGYMAGEDDVLASVRFMESANLLYQEIFVKAASPFKYSSAETFKNLLIPAQNFADNAGLLKTEKDRDGLSPEVLKIIQGRINLPHCEKIFRGNLKKLLMVEKAAAKPSGQSFDAYRLAEFMGIREVYKSYYPKQELPQDLRLGSLTAEGLNDYALNVRLAKYFNIFNPAPKQLYLPAKKSPNNGNKMIFKQNSKGGSRNE